MNIPYIETPPDTIDCLYCGQPCVKTEPYRVITEYFCNNHGEAEVMFRCAKHDIEGPSWFFNVIKVTRGKWRLSWNFYAGKWAWLEKLVPHEEKKWGEHWAPVSTTIPSAILQCNIKIASSFLNLYRVFS
jgi:hypothetical protein